MPLKDGIIDINVSLYCRNLTTVTIVGGIHKTIASLHLESWRNDMRQEINRINQVLPSHPYRKTAEIQQWIRSVIRLLAHYKEEHKALLKEATTLLELALWKSKIDNEGGTRGQRRCVTSGASIVIKNVLPFLQLE
jgi:hypothetical protein